VELKKRWHDVKEGSKRGREKEKSEKNSRAEKEVASCNYKVLVYVKGASWEGQNSNG